MVLSSNFFEKSNPFDLDFNKDNKLNLYVGGAIRHFSRRRFGSETNSSTHKLQLNNRSRQQCWQRVSVNRLRHLTFGLNSWLYLQHPWLLV